MRGYTGVTWSVLQARKLRNEKPAKLSFTLLLVPDLPQPVRRDQPGQDPEPDHGVREEGGGEAEDRGQQQRQRDRVVHDRGHVIVPGGGAPCIIRELRDGDGVSERVATCNGPADASAAKRDRYFN